MTAPQTTTSAGEGEALAEVVPPDYRAWRRSLIREQFAHVPQYKPERRPVSADAFVDLLDELTPVQLTEAAAAVRTRRRQQRKSS
jgi:hypothetical protein